MPFSATDAVSFFRDAGFQLLNIRPEHAAAVEQLPAFHPDPFDRLLIAQARVEPMHLLTHDKTLSRYGATVVVV